MSIANAKEILVGWESGKSSLSRYKGTLVIAITADLMSIPNMYKCYQDKFSGRWKIHVALRLHTIYKQDIIAAEYLYYWLREITGEGAFGNRRLPLWGISEMVSECSGHATRELSLVLRH